MIDDILAWDNLCRAWERVADNRGAPGVDRVSVARYARQWERNLRILRDLAQTGRYRPAALRRIAIPKAGGGQRLISIPTVADRVLQRATLNLLEGRLDRRLMPCSFGYRPGRGVRDAVRAVLAYRDRGLAWMLDADIDECFDSLDHALLLDFWSQEVDDPRVLALLAAWVEGGRRYRNPSRGIALGMPISPLCCNLYLHRLDQGLVRGRWALVRYADDFVVCCPSQAAAERARAAVEALLGPLRLRLEPSKTRIVSLEQGLDFLGVHFDEHSYSFLWQEKRLTVQDSAPGWLWSYLPEGYQE